MLYFILWVVFIVVCILAVIVTAVMGKPKRPKAAQPIEMAEDDDVIPDGEDAVAEEPMVEDNAFQSEPVAVDDFSAFDDEFK